MQTITIPATAAPILPPEEALPQPGETPIGEATLREEPWLRRVLAALHSVPVGTVLTCANGTEVWRRAAGWYLGIRGEPAVKLESDHGYPWFTEHVFFPGPFTYRVPNGDRQVLPVRG